VDNVTIDCFGAAMELVIGNSLADGMLVLFQLVVSRCVPIFIINVFCLLSVYTETLANYSQPLPLPSTIGPNKHFCTYYCPPVEMFANTVACSRCETHPVNP